MRDLILILTASLITLSINADDAYSDYMVNSAFYNGQKLTYVLPPPTQFTMVVTPARAEGYSFGFIPEDASYDSAGLMIGVTIINLIDEDSASNPFEIIVTEDTLEMRQFYGTDLDILPTDSIFNNNGHYVVTLELKAPDRHIPTAMLAYYDGKTEIVILEALIQEWFPRYEAAEIFRECIENFRVLKRKPWGQ